MGSDDRSRPNGSAETESGDFVVLVPVSNPRSESHLIALAAAIANHRNGRVVAISIVRVPDQTSLEAARDKLEHRESEDLLAGARRDATAVGAPIETHTVFSHRLFKTIMDSARGYEADVCLMGWGPKTTGIAGRTESLGDELASSLPCDFLVFKDRGFDPSRVLVPTTGGPHSALAACVARILHAAFGSDVTLLHVNATTAAGERFLEEWALEHGLESADRRTATGDIEAAIAAESRDQTMVLIGATEAGVLSRLARGALTLDVLEEVACSVFIAERKTERSLFRRVFARR